jgi:hypothetical protein
MMIIGIVTGVFAISVSDTSIKSFHWQPGKGYKVIGDTIYCPALLSAGSYSACSLKTTIKEDNWVKAVDNALWLDTNGDGKRYVCKPVLPTSYTINNLGLSCMIKDSSIYSMKNKILFFCMRNDTSVYVNRTDTTTAFFVISGYKSFSQYIDLFIRKDTLIIQSEASMASYYPTGIKDTIPLNLTAANKAGTWIPFWIQFDRSYNKLIIDTGIIRIGIGNVTYDSIKVLNSDIAILSGAEALGFSAAVGEISDINLFCTNDTSITGSKMFNTFFGDSVVAVDTTTVPLMIHDIIYDPPGNESYSTVQFDSSIATTFDYGVSTSTSASLEIGIRLSISEGVGVSVTEEATSTLKGEAHFSWDSTTSNQVALSTTTSTSSMVNEDDAAYIGPTFGDVLVYQSYVYATLMAKRPIMSKFRTASKAQDFVWAVYGCIPLTDKCSAVYYKPIKTVLADLKNDSSGRAFLQKEYPYNLTTGKLMDSVLLSSKDSKGNYLPPRVERNDTGSVISGGLPIENSTTREHILSTNTNYSWGVSLTSETAIWAGAGFDLTISQGVDGSLTYGKTTSGSSTIGWHFQDNTVWDTYKIYTYRDNRFKTILFVVDSANSYTSFPYEKANSKAAVTWKVDSIHAVSGFVGQETVVKINVKNTSPRGILTALPDSFQFSVSPINFPGTMTVYPENGWIKTNDSMDFTCTFVGADTGTFAQSMQIICYHPTNGSTMTETKSFPMTLKTADMGLYVSIAQDTALLSSDSTIFHTFSIKLINKGSLSGNIVFGADSASAGTTVNYGSFTNPVASGDTANLSISLTGNGTKKYYTAWFWTEIEGEASTLTHHCVVINASSSGILKNRTCTVIRELGMASMGKGRLELMVPDNESPTLRLFSINGNSILTMNPKAGRTVINMNDLHLSNGFYIIRMQGKNKMIQQKMIMSSKK